MKILIVEDSSAFARTLEKILQELKHQVYRATDVSRAMGFIRSYKFDCIILDLNIRVTGLTSAQIKKTSNGLGTGWIWLKEKVLYSDIEIDYKNKTIICSAYQDEFKAKMPIEFEEILEIGIPFVRREDAPGEILEYLEKMDNK
jgi:CheY-like chemotaxis protein